MTKETAPTPNTPKNKTHQRERRAKHITPNPTRPDLISTSPLDEGPCEHDDDADDGGQERVQTRPVLEARLLARLGVPLLGGRGVDEGRQRPDLCARNHHRRGCIYSTRNRTAVGGVGPERLVGWCTIVCTDGGRAVLKIRQRSDLCAVRTCSVMRNRISKAYVRSMTGEFRENSPARDRSRS